MALYSSTYLKQLSANTNTYEKQRIINESKAQLTFDIFLSHSFLDKDEVEGLFLEFTKQGYSVYVDWIVDAHLDRNKVTKQTAELIRNRMKASKSLLLAISSNAAMSKWMPWELGYIDGKANKCAIVPVAKESINEKTFVRSEYLLLYPYIKNAQIDALEKAYIVEDSNYYVQFDNWIRNNSAPSYNSKNIEFL